MFRADTNEPEEELNIEERKAEKIEKLLRWKKTGRGQPPAYLVLWKGHPLEEATWEPASRFETEKFKQLLLRDEPEEIDDEGGRS